MRIITSTGDLAAFCDELSSARFVTVDTEFMRDSTYWPKLCLIQLAGPSSEAIIDPLSKDLSLEPFFELMTRDSVVKVFHAARQDLEIFHHLAEVIPHPLYDTQVAAMVCGFGESAGYETLVRKLTDESVDKSSRFTDWSRRPLSEAQLRYAISDVTHLRKVYEILSHRVTLNGRDHWLAEEMAVLESPATYVTHPEDAWKRLKRRYNGKKALGVLIETAAWREIEAQRRDVPRQRVLKDEALFELAAERPSSPKELERLRSISKGFGNSAQGKSLLEAVARGLAIPKDKLPKVERPEPPAPGIGPLVDLLKVLLKLRCEEQHVAPKLIASAADLERIAAEDQPDVPAMSGWRREVFGDIALALKNGEVALAANGKKIIIQPTGKGSAGGFQESA